jgi:hypothetical protein
MVEIIVATAGVLLRARYNDETVEWNFHLLVIDGNEKYRLKQEE